MKFTPEHEALRQTWKTLIDREINPHVDEWEKEGHFPAHELFKKMGNAGLLGVDKPVEFGGSGLDFSYAMVCSESLGLVNGGSMPMATGVQIRWRRRRSPATAATSCARNSSRPRSAATTSPASASRRPARAPTSPRSRPPPAGSAATG